MNLNILLHLFIIQCAALETNCIIDCITFPSSKIYEVIFYCCAHRINEIMFVKCFEFLKRKLLCKYKVLLSLPRHYFFSPLLI